MINFPKHNSPRIFQIKAQMNKNNNYLLIMLQQRIQKILNKLFRRSINKIKT